MIPGQTTKLTEKSVVTASVIDAKSDILFLLYNGTVETINPHFGGGFAGFVILIVSQGSTVSLGITGNISLAAPLPLAVNKPTFLTYSKITRKWYVTVGA